MGLASLAFLAVSPLALAISDDAVTKLLKILGGGQTIMIAPKDCFRAEANAEAFDLYVVV